MEHEGETRSVAFTVLGTPAPKGSMKAFVPKGWRRAILTNDNPKTSSWQQAVAHAAREKWGQYPPLLGPVTVVATFYLPRPPSAKAAHVEPYEKKADIDKLLRSVLDGVTASGVIKDDCQVLLIKSSKCYAGGALDWMHAAGIPRAEVVVSPCRRMYGKWPGIAGLAP